QAEDGIRDFHVTGVQTCALPIYLDLQIRANVTRINSLAQRIAQLNGEIRQVLAAGDTPNDLYDTRDMLIEELSRIADIQVIDREGGMVAVTIGGVTLVEGVNYRAIEVINASDTGFAELTWSGTNLSVHFKSGEMKALFDARDELIPHYM